MTSIRRCFTALALTLVSATGGFTPPAYAESGAGLAADGHAALNALHANSTKAVGRTAEAIRVFVI